MQLLLRGSRSEHLIVPKPRLGSTVLEFLRYLGCVVPKQVEKTCGLVVLGGFWAAGSHKSSKEKFQPKVP